MEPTSPVYSQPNVRSEQPQTANPYQVVQPQTQQQTQPLNPQNTQINYAGFWIRCLAQMVDSAIWSLNFFAPLYLLSAFGSSNIKVFVPSFLWFMLYVFLASPLFKFFAHPWLISRLGAGAGKMACGLEIVNCNKSRLTYKNALFREYIAKIASNGLLGLGYCWILKSSQRQGWHDGLAGTYVVKKHSGALAGLMSLITMLAVVFGLGYKAFDNFKNAKTLQYDIVTLVTQIRQDFAETPVPKSAPSDLMDDGDSDYLNRINNIDINDIDIEVDADNPFESGENGEYEKYKDMPYDELLKELEKLNTQ